MYFLTSSKKGVKIPNTIDSKIIIHKLYFILGRSELRWNFSSIPKDGSDIQIFQQEVGLNHVHCWKSVYIRDIPKSTGKIPT